MANYPAVDDLDDLVVTNPAADGSEDAAKITDALLETRRVLKNVILKSHDHEGNILAAAITGAVGAAVPDGSITGGPAGAGVKIAAATITSDNLAANAVTTAKITDANVTTAKLADGAVTTAKLANDAVTAVNILDGTITSAKLAAGASNIPNGTLSAAQLTPVAGGPKMLITNPAGTPNDSWTAVKLHGAIDVAADGNVTLLAGAAIVALPMAQAIEKQASGAPAGGLVAGTYTARSLNYEIDPNSIIAIDVSGYFTLTAGTYVIQAVVPGYSCGLHKAHLADVTAWSATPAVSQPVLAFDGTTACSPDGCTTYSHIYGVAIVTGTVKFGVFHRCTVSKTTNGRGAPANFPAVAPVTPFSADMFAAGALGGDAEYYTVVTITKDSVMPTIKQLQNRQSLAGGINGYQAPHLLGDSQWLDSIQVRHARGVLSQFPVLKTGITLPLAKDPSGNAITDSAVDIVNGLVALPSRFAYTSVLAFTDRTAFHITDNNTIRQIRQVGTPPAYAIGPYINFNRSPTPYRWALKSNSNVLFFTNPNNPIRYTTGTLVGSYENTMPSGQYLEVFYDHLIVGRPTWRGVPYLNRVMWSDLQGFDTFAPQTYNEADFYEVYEDDSTDAQLSGVTGVKNLANRLFNGCLIYTPTSISAVQYTNIQAGTFKFDPIVMDIGNCFQWSLASYVDHHAFIGVDNFYAFDGVKVTPIGDPVIDFFYADLNTNPTNAQKTFAFVDKPNHEVWWCYQSKRSVSSIDSALIFNYQEGKWYRQQDNSIGGYIPAQNTYHSIGTYTGTTIGALTGTILDQGNAGVVKTSKLFGGRNKTILIEAAVDETGTYSMTTPPTFITGDFVYNNLEEFKEIETMVIHASYVQADGIDVYYSARRNIEDPIVWSLAATWTPSLHEGRLSFPRTSGRVFRYKFVVRGTNGVRGLRFSAYGDNVYGLFPQQRPEK